MPTRQTKHRLRLAVRGFLLTVVLWALVLTFNWHVRAHYPDRPEPRQDVLLVAMIIEFLTIKAFVLACRTPKRDWLGWSLVGFNAVFALYWLAVLEISVLPPLIDWRPVGWVIKGAIWLVTLWGLVELIRLDDPCDDEPQDQEDRGVNGLP